MEKAPSTTVILSQYFRSANEYSNCNLTALIECVTALLESIDIS